MALSNFSKVRSIASITCPFPYPTPQFAAHSCALIRQVANESPMLVYYPAMDGVGPADALLQASIVPPASSPAGSAPASPARDSSSSSSNPNTAPPSPSPNGGGSEPPSPSAAAAPPAAAASTGTNPSPPATPTDPDTHTLILRDLPVTTSPASISALFAPSDGAAIKDVSGPHLNGTFYVALKLEPGGDAVDLVLALAGRKVDGHAVKARLKTETTISRQVSERGEGGGGERARASAQSGAQEGVLLR
jgi:hypothetical protein